MMSAGAHRASASTYDGPAELPRVMIQTAMANTPAPGITTVVKAGENLQTVLNNAQCGDTIMLEAGTSFSGPYTFPNKSCDDAHWIIVRTSSEDSLLPAQTSRVTPCYAGVSSLPGRPALNCTSTRNVLAKLVVNRAGSGPIIFAAGANHYRLIGLELTRAAGIGLVEALAAPASGVVTSKIIYDRIWFHGSVHDDTVRGVQIAGSTYVSIINSFFTDFHCVAGGPCQDAQAIHGGIGDHPMGPYKIFNNFLEASGENIMLGGGAASYTPADVEIGHNHFFKPLTWLRGQPGYVGGANGHPFVVKNLLELKNAQRVLAEGNVMEYTWGGFSQAGFAILLTPKNPYNTCPKCLVTDITIRYSKISHMGSGLQLANVLDDSGHGALDGERYSFHDLIMDDINPVKYVGSGHGAEIMTVRGTALLKYVSINHITSFAPVGALMIGNTSSTKIPSLIFSNNLITAGAYPVWSTGGGTANCAFYDEPITTFTACFDPYSFSHNAVVASPSSYPASRWPSDNLFPATVNAVQFVNYNGGNGGDYQLLASSPYKNAATDGKDVGADVNAINTATTGVE